ncbi:MAG: serine/threonine-protein phosphatase [Melioribacteraceae bacterium]|nr:serine/threonine-protein phosphatase [Melioribacteraceae bacterium]
MEQKKLYRTLETIETQHYNNEVEMLQNVIKLIINNENNAIIGGRVWRLDTVNKCYRLLFQTDNVTRIDDDFQLFVEENEILKEVTEKRTILSEETNEKLREKGINKFLATGIGDKLKINGSKYYEYLLAVNSENIDDSLRYTLNIVATFLTSSLHSRKSTAHRKNLIDDIDKAKQLQKSILPEHQLNFHNYEIFGVALPAETLGGDYFDYLRIGEDESRLGIVVGDAASKGLSAAAEAMYISGAVRMACNFQIKISPMMYKLNNLVNKIFSDDRFTTLFYGEISNDSRGLFLFANGGHNPPLFVRSKTKEIQYLDTTGPLLGPAPNSAYETDSINFRKGDTLVIFSDGIVESANNNFEFYGEKRLEEVTLKNIDKTPKEIVYAIMDDVIKFSTDDSKYQDDKTIVIIKKVK